MDDRSAGVVGLCETCRWVERVANRRGSVFYRCGRAAFDPSYAKYPRLPVSLCEGHEPVAAQGAADPAD